MLGKFSLLTAPFLTIFVLNQGLQALLMSEVALMQLNVLPATLGEDLALCFHGISFPAVSWSRIPISATRGNNSWPHHWFWWIYSISMAPWMNWSSLPPNLLTPVGDDTTMANPKGLHGMRAQPLHGSVGTSLLSKHWRTKPEERDKLLDVITVDPSPSSLRTLLMHPHIPHSVQSRVVQAKQNNLTSETRIS